jgi:hypothetical protein
LWHFLEETVIATAAAEENDDPNYAIAAVASETATKGTVVIVATAA